MVIYIMKYAFISKLNAMRIREQLVMEVIGVWNSLNH